MSYVPLTLWGCSFYKPLKCILLLCHLSAAFLHSANAASVCSRSWGLVAFLSLSPEVCFFLPVSKFTFLPQHYQSLLWYVLLTDSFFFSVHTWTRLESKSELESLHFIWENAIHMPLYSQNATNTWGWARMKPGVSNSIQISHISVRDQALEPSPATMHSTQYQEAEPGVRCWGAWA